MLHASYKSCHDTRTNRSRRLNFDFYKIEQPAMQAVPEVYLGMEAIIYRNALTQHRYSSNLPEFPCNC